MFGQTIQDFINQQKAIISDEKLKLVEQDYDNKYDEENDEEVYYSDSQDIFEEKENFPTGDLENFIGHDEIRMLKYGEYSPNNPRMRVATQPYLGVGEYEQRKKLLLEQRKADFQQNAEKAKHSMDKDNTFVRKNFKGSRAVVTCRDKSVQTDIQNINTQLIQYDVPSQFSKEKEKSPRSRGLKIDKVQIETQNNIIFPGHSKYLDKIDAHKTNSPRAKLMADLQSSYIPTLMGYTAVSSQNDERLEKARRQEKYLAELRQQIEEKQKLLEKHKEQERLEQEIATKRLESQLRDISFEEKQFLGRQPVNYDNKLDKTYSNSRYKPRYYEITDKKINSCTSSPPLSRRDKPPYSFNIPSNSVFANAVPVRDKNISNSKLAIDNKYATKENQKLANTSNTKLDESLPIPVLKAQSPVAKELINAVAVQSKTSDAMRKLEDKWQIPAVQKNIIKTADRQADGSNQGVLTQLGAIRLQLQQEQLRLDETLRKRGVSQSIVHADVHRNLN